MIAGVVLHFDDAGVTSGTVARATLPMERAWQRREQADVALEAVIVIAGVKRWLFKQGGVAMFEHPEVACNVVAFDQARNRYADRAEGFCGGRVGRKRRRNSLIHFSSRPSQQTPSRTKR